METGCLLIDNYVCVYAVMSRNALFSTVFTFKKGLSQEGDFYVETHEGPITVRLLSTRKGLVIW